MCFFIVFSYPPEIDFPFNSAFAQRVLAGDIFTPYSPILIDDMWRLSPPLWLWWITYNYWIYGFDVIIWRVLNLILEVGIVYLMIQIFHENSASEKGWSEENFKIGLSFYTFSFLPVVVVLLYTNFMVLPILLGMIGFLYYFRSKRNPKYLYYSILFFSLSALIEYFAAIWILGILVVLCFQKNFRRFFLLAGESIALFCIISLPFLLNDVIGFLQRMFWHFKTYSTSYDGAVWLLNTHALNLPESINYLPVFFAIVASLYYTHRTSKSNLSLDFFIVNISIFLFYSPTFNPLHYLWIYPLICISIIHSFRKFFLNNLMFFGIFIGFLIGFIHAYLTYPGPILPNMQSTYALIYGHYMVSGGYMALYFLLGQFLVHIGFTYLIFCYTHSKKFVLFLMSSFVIYYIINLCFPINF
ncbi:MAG: hypothetical protein ACTSRS_22590 [Candidatus Helarchaeota archaeon]